MKYVMQLHCPRFTYLFLRCLAHRTAASRRATKDFYRSHIDEVIAMCYALSPTLWDT
jgi:hypothetical protein